MYVLITGASGGIGEVFAREYARRKRNVILVARSGEKLQAVASALAKEHGVRAEVIAQDLSTPGSAEALHAACAARGLEVDVLVNNAGFGLIGEFLESDLAKVEEMLQLNIVTLTKLCGLFLPAMVARNTGGIINVASTAAFQPVPFMAAYAASKAYVLSLSEGLHQELQGTSVNVLALCPGATATNFFHVAQEGKESVKLPMDTPERVVAQALAAFEARQASTIPGFRNRMMAFSQRFASRGLVARIAGAMMRPT